MISVSTHPFLITFLLPLVLPIVEAVETRDTTALLSGVVLSITGIYACLEGVYMHEEEMDRRDFKGPS
ncbi:hypothetical protein FD755_013133 [Muntiacus reevesi]|uniref:Uncharacterized protein n=1 Tax=Muntiacus reevesi TaxID=9886 RepID=A0A5N3XQ16_MUNRE|nr:hypothetical protein FD755_013133 [Muntiacus reevesi]